MSTESHRSDDIEEKQPCLHSSVPREGAPDVEGIGGARDTSVDFEFDAEDRADQVLVPSPSTSSSSSEKHAPAHSAFYIDDGRKRARRGGGNGYGEGGASFSKGARAVVWWAKCLPGRKRVRLVCIFTVGLALLLITILLVWFYVFGNSYIYRGCDILATRDPSLRQRSTGPAGFCHSHGGPDGSPTQFFSGAPISFLVIGDWGRDGWCCQRDVAKELSNAADKLNTDAIVNVGDNFYPDGLKSASDAQLKSSFHDVCK